ncbi:uncharacterized protein LOC110857611 isoform X2 [Folsomia candida]|uniref:uncharacterized protein LOC110857611 isoform X2 n=1 Tax=Folsomia candida TaxID=158441 RepID=UPI000B8FDCB8|nr:uncharacterized protein LOC110857611 isoform X2 [Folsomia candida]
MSEICNNLKPTGSGQPRNATTVDIHSVNRGVPFWVEFGVTAGLGFAVYLAPASYAALRESAQVWWPRVSKSFSLLVCKVRRGLEPMIRRRRNGSIIRVIADLLPDFVFGPTPRIFISGVSASNYDGDVVGRGRQSRVEGMIVAFELDEESEYAETIDEIDVGKFEEEEVSSNPEGWDAFPLFQPCAHSTRFRSSTPDFSLPDSEITDSGDNINAQEFVSLKQTVEMLMLQISQLNLNITQNHAAVGAVRGGNPPSPLPEVSRPLPPVSESSSNKCVPTAGAPPPPPPPPPPMPPTVFKGSADPIKLTKSSQKQKPAPISMMDVLKDMKTVQLKKGVPTSPGGTPIKNQTKPKTSLENVLFKRFHSMNPPSPVPSEDVSFSDDDKENEFNDSALVTSKSPRGRALPRTLFGENNSSNQLPLFGPHLLKSRRDQN